MQGSEGAQERSRGAGLQTRDQRRAHPADVPSGCAPAARQTPGQSADQPHGHRSPALRDLNGEQSTGMLANVSRKERAAGSRMGRGAAGGRVPRGQSPAGTAGGETAKAGRPVPRPSGSSTRFHLHLHGPFPRLGSATSSQCGSGLPELPAAPSPSLGTHLNVLFSEEPCWWLLCVPEACDLMDWLC